jgi:hypothetical protein
MKFLSFFLIFVLGNVALAQNNDILTIPYNGNTPKPSTQIDTTQQNEPLIPAQSNGKSNMMIIEGYLPVAFPHGQFRSLSSDMWGIGFGGGVMYNPFTNSVNSEWIRPYVLGLQFDYIWFSSASTKTETTISNRNFDVVYKLNTGAFSFGYQGKVEFFDTKIYPFIAYQAGFRYFEGVQKIKYTAEYTDDQQYAPADVRNNISGSFTSYFGYGGGIGFGKETLRFELKVMRQIGSEAKYVDPKSVVANPDNTFTYSSKKSTTDMIVPQLTLSLHF